LGEQPVVCANEVGLRLYIGSGGLWLPWASARSHHRIDWASLLRRPCDTEVLSCRNFGGKAKVPAVIEDDAMATSSPGQTELAIWINESEPVRGSGKHRVRIEVDRERLRAGHHLLPHAGAEAGCELIVRRDQIRDRERDVT
jgi:hypothetical protein